MGFFFIFRRFLARQHILNAMARYMLSPSVCHTSGSVKTQKR